MGTAFWWKARLTLGLIESRRRTIGRTGASLGMGLSSQVQNRKERFTTPEEGISFILSDYKRSPLDLSKAHIGMHTKNHDGYPVRAQIKLRYRRARWKKL
ncbi:hypothetical protein GCM10027396_10330 [Insolitispirillum peregrinum]